MAYVGVDTLINQEPQDNPLKAVKQWAKICAYDQKLQVHWKKERKIKLKKIIQRERTTWSWKFNDATSFDAVGVIASR